MTINVNELPCSHQDTARDDGHVKTCLVRATAYFNRTHVILKSLQIDLSLSRTIGAMRNVPHPSMASDCPYFDGEQT